MVLLLLQTKYNSFPSLTVSISHLLPCSDLQGVKLAHLTGFNAMILQSSLPVFQLLDSLKAAAIFSVCVR